MENKFGKTQRREIKLGMGVMYPAPGMIERLGAAWDWIWLDAQHGQLANYDVMLSMVRACDLVGTPAYVRVPGHDAGWIGLALDMGAEGVIVPQVDSVEQARALVRSVAFPPIGNRSYGGRRVIDRKGRGYYEHPPRLICQIESPEGLSAADQIASIPGVDGLFLGPDDLSLRWGESMLCPGDKPRMNAAVERVATICQRESKDCFCIAANAETFRQHMEFGVNYLICGVDVGFIANAAQGALQWANECRKDERRRDLTNSSSTY